MILDTVLSGLITLTISLGVAVWFRHWTLELEVDLVNSAQVRMSLVTVLPTPVVVACRLVDF